MAFTEKMIRDYRAADFPACVGLVNKVWAFDKRFYPQELAELFKKVYTGGSIAASNFLKVVEIKGKMSGFLFGKIDNRKLFKNEYSGIIGQLRIIIKLFSIRGVSFKRKLMYLKYINTHEINRRKVEPRKDSEVNLFVVDPDNQGKGFGKRLMNEFITFCKNKNVKRIVLETDKESNYGFYQHLGFKVKGSFYSPILKEYSGESGDTLVYELELRDYPSVFPLA